MKMFHGYAPFLPDQHVSDKKQHNAQDAKVLLQKQSAAWAWVIMLVNHVNHMNRQSRKSFEGYTSKSRKLFQLHIQKRFPQET